MISLDLHVYLMRNKGESFDMFKHYKTKVEIQKDRKIKILRSDRSVNIFLMIFLRFVRNMA